MSEFLLRGTLSAEAFDAMLETLAKVLTTWARKYSFAEVYGEYCLQQLGSDRDQALCIISKTDDDWTTEHRATRRTKEECIVENWRKNGSIAMMLPDASGMLFSLTPTAAPNTTFPFVTSDLSEQNTLIRALCAVVEKVSGRTLKLKTETRSGAVGGKAILKAANIDLESLPVVGKETGTRRRYSDKFVLDTLRAFRLENAGIDPNETVRAVIERLETALSFSDDTRAKAQNLLEIELGLRPWFVIENDENVFSAAF